MRVAQSFDSVVAQSAADHARQHLENTRERVATADAESLPDALAELAATLGPVDAEEAVDVANRCLELVTGDDGEPLAGHVVPFVRATLLISQVDARIGRVHEAEEAALRALGLATACGDTPCEAEAQRTLGTILSLANRFTEAKERLEEGRALYASISEPLKEAQCVVCIGAVHATLGESDAAAAAFEEGVRLHDGLEGGETLAKALANLAMVQFDRGQMSDAIAALHQSRAVMERMDDAEGIAATWSNLGTVHARLGDHRRALECYAQSFESSGTGRRLDWEVMTQVDIATAHLALGEIPEAREAAEHAKRIAGNTDLNRLRADTRLVLAEIARQEERLDDALVEATEAHRQAEKAGLRRQMAESLGLRAQVLRLLDRYDEAAVVAQWALDIALSMDNDRAVCDVLLEQARVARAQGDLSAAEAVLRDALARFEPPGQSETEAETRRELVHVLREAERHEEALAEMERLRSIEESRAREALARQAGDIEARRQLELADRAIEARDLENEELRSANLELNRLHRVRSELLGTLAHEMRNPLMAVMGHASLGHTHARKAGDEEGERRFQQVMDAVGRMAATVDAMLETGTSDDSNPVVDVLPVDVRPIVSDCVDLVRDAADAKGIEIRASVPLLPLNAQADIRAVRGALDHLISNALKFSPVGRQVTVRAARIDGPLPIVVEVQDRGPGIAEEERSQLFQRFSRLSARPTAGESSSGLGLYAAYTLVTAMNGRIEVDSTLGEGTTFRVLLPASGV